LERRTQTEVRTQHKTQDQLKHATRVPTEAFPESQRHAPLGTKPKEDPRSLKAALHAVATVLEKKGVEPVLLDVRALASYADYILVVSGRSDRQVQAISDGLLKAFAEKGTRPLGVEGRGEGHWTLCDFGDVIVHVFYHPMREFYDLEGLWHDAARVPLDLPADAHLSPGDQYGA
jgi:ribosome-associated protein